MLDGFAETVTVGVISDGAVTITDPVPDALVYVDEADQKWAVSVFGPMDNELAGTVSTASLLPLTPLGVNPAAPTLLSALSVTSPVGGGFPLPPLTVTVTVVLPVVLMLDGFGEIVTVGVMAGDMAVTVTDPVPNALGYAYEAVIKMALSVLLPTDSELA